MSMKNPMTSAGIEPATFRFVEQHLNHCATAVRTVTGYRGSIETLHFGHFRKYHLKILVGDFNGNLGGVDILKPTIGNESLHHDSNNNGVRIVYFARSKHLVVKSMMFLH